MDHVTDARRIRSRDNPHYRALWHLLQSGRQRRRQRRAVLEGVHLCQAWWQRVGAFQAVFVCESACGHPEVQALLAQFAQPPWVLTKTLYAAVSTVEHGVGLLGVIDLPVPSWPMPPYGDWVYLDGAQDPGNVGTILRTCAAAGIATVMTAPTTVGCWSPKVLRAGMGAHAVLTIHEAVSWSEVQTRWTGPVLGTAARGAHSVFQVDVCAPALWVFGHEGQGISHAVAAAVTQWLTIPQVTTVESLNVASAAAICLFEQRRQRLQGHPGAGAASML